MADVKIVSTTYEDDVNQHNDATTTLTCTRQQQRGRNRFPSILSGTTGFATEDLDQDEAPTAHAFG